MLRDFAEPAESPDGAARPAGLLVTQRGWRSQDLVERAALEAMVAYGPLAAPSLMAVYAGFPWSAYLDCLDQPDALETPFLQTALRTLRLLAPRRQVNGRSKGAAIVTVCQHPRLAAHLERLAEAGVSDVFWSAAPSADALGPQPCGITLHPFPALPDPAAAAPAGEGPGAAFVFCPADNGGNTARLWGAVAAGLIPVLGLRQTALPGPVALWAAAAVLHDGAEADLTARLQAIAEDAERLAQMRRSVAGLNLLYGPGRLVHDVLTCLLARSGEAAPPQDPSGQPGDPSLLRPLISRFKDRQRLDSGEATLVAQQAATDLLCDSGSDLRLSPGPQSAAAWRLVALARSALPASSPALLRLDAVLGHLRDRNRLSAKGPGAAGQPRPPGSPIRVFLLGPRGQRTPLSYAPMRPHLGQRLAFVGAADEADLVVTGWSRDLEENQTMLAALARSRSDGGPRLVVLSEEPLWDSLWSGGDLTARDRRLADDAAPLAYRCVNHTNSDIFAFRHLPWFVLSADSFAARHAMLIAGFAAMRPRALLAHWAAAPLQAAFVAERRMTPDCAAAFPRERVAGLCLYRSRVAEWTPGPAVLRLGQGWPGTTERRQALADWHLDKLARLHGRVRVCAAYENTLQRDYITEKPFDAFALGAIPAVVADGGHRLFDLISPEAMLNTVHDRPEVAAARIASLVPDLPLAEAWRDSAQRLVTRFRDVAAIARERQRIADACLGALEDALHENPASPPPPP